MKNFEGYVNNKITPLWYLIADSFTLCSQFKVPILLRTLQMVDNTIHCVSCLRFIFFKMLYSKISITISLYLAITTIYSLFNHVYKFIIINICDRKRKAL